MTPDITDLALGSIRTLRELTQRIPFGGGILADSLHNAVKGKTILITGASSGIGEAASLQIGKAGGKLLLVARTKDKLDAVAERVQDVGGTAFVHTCDLSDSEDVERMAREVLSQHGHVDILVNNAGKSIRRSVDRSYDRFHDYQRTMALNYFAPVKPVCSSS
jgi:short-subunit dehydrogenase